MRTFNARNVSVLSAVAAGACCLPPLIILLLSLGSVAWGATLARYHWWFLGAGALLLGGAYLLYFRERRACSSEGCAMPRRKLTLGSLIFGTLVVGAFAANSFAPMMLQGRAGSGGKIAAAAEAANLEFATLPVEGMTCFSCELHVEQVLGEVPGIVDAEASTINQSVEVSFHAGQVGVEDIVEAINTKTGYKARLPEPQGL